MARKRTASPTIGRALAGPKITTLARRAARDELKRREVADKQAADKKTPLMQFFGNAFGGDGLQNLVSGLGSGSDPRVYTDYQPSFALTRFQLENMWRSSWLAGRIVTTVADDMTRAWLDCTWDGYDAETDAAKLRIVEDTFAVRARVKTGLDWGRLYGGAVMIVGIKGQDPSQPLVLDSIGKDMLESLTVLDRWWCAPTGQLVRKTKDLAFGMPEMYTVSAPGESGALVHHTRVIRFNGRPLPMNLWLMNGFWDDSELQHVVDSIKDYDSTRAGIAALIFSANLDIMKVPNMIEQLSTADGTKILNDRFSMFNVAKSIYRLCVVDKEEELTNRTVNFSGMTNVIEKFMIDVCGAADIPMTRLFGQSPSGMTATGESDIRNYYDHIAAKQERQLRPQIQRLYEILMRHTFGNMPEDFSFKFNPLWQMSAKEKSEIELARAQRDQIYLDKAVLTEGAVARELKDSETYRTMEDEDVDMAEELANQPEEVPPDYQPINSPAARAAGATPGVRRIPGQPPKPAADRKYGGDRRYAADIIRREENGSYNIYSERTGKLLAGPFSEKSQAVKRLGQIEYFKQGKNDGSQVVSNYDFQDFKLAIENPAGTIRTWKDDNDQTVGQTPMQYDYGYFQDYVGSDGDELDVYCGPDADAPHVHIVNQLATPDYVQYDEQKVMLGFRDPAQAKKAYLAHRNDGEQAFGGMTVMPVESFRAQLQRRRGIGKIK